MAYFPEGYAFNPNMVRPRGQNVTEGVSAEEFQAFMNLPEAARKMVRMSDGEYVRGDKVQQHQAAVTDGETEKRQFPVKETVATLGAVGIAALVIRSVRKRPKGRE